jgi:hypothetical protein
MNKKLTILLSGTNHYGITVIVRGKLQKGCYILNIQSDLIRLQKYAWNLELHNLLGQKLAAGRQGLFTVCE